MVKQTPFHPRTSQANQTGLWSHWAGYLATEKYQMAEKFEYFAIRNAAGMIDTSPLYKYAITGSESELFLAGVLTRDIRKCGPGHAQYTVWCDDEGWVLEDGVVLRRARDEFMLTTARPNLAYLEDLTGSLDVEIKDVSDEVGALAIQGPVSRTVLREIVPEVDGMGYFGVAEARIGDAEVTISRTGYTGDLGYEIWVAADRALDVWDRIAETGAPHGVIPCGQISLLISRIEAGLILIDVDYHSARFAWNDDQRLTPSELGLGWMIGDLGADDRPFIGRRALQREAEQGNSRWATVGVIVDWADWARIHNERGLVTPKDHIPDHGGRMIYDEESNQIGHAPSFVYSPVLQEHVGIARIRPEFAGPGRSVGLEVTIDHRYDMVEARVAKLPFYNPPRKTD